MMIKRKYILENEKGNSIELSFSSDFILQKFEGLSHIEIDLSTSKTLSQIGDTITNKYIKSKTLTINGIIKNNTIYNRNKLIDIVTPLSKLKLKCILEDGFEYYLDVIASKTPIIENIDSGPKFQFDLMAAYPFWVRKDKTTTKFQTVKKLFKFPVTFKGSYMLGQTIREDFVTVRNEGNFSTGLEIKIFCKGIASNFSIQNVITLEYIKLNYTSVAGELITITTGYNNKKVTSNKNGDITKNLDLINTTFLQLEPGENIFKFQAQTGLNNTLVEMNFDIIKVGI